MDETIYGKCGYLSVKWEFRKKLWHEKGYRISFYLMGGLKRKSVNSPAEAGVYIGK